MSRNCHIAAASDALPAIREGSSVLLDATPPALHPEVFEGASRFDIARWADSKSCLPNTMMDKAMFDSCLEFYGIDRHSTGVFICERTPLYASGRVWWMLRSMGVDSVRVVDGGIPALMHADAYDGVSSRAVVPEGSAHGGLGEAAGRRVDEYRTVDAAAVLEASQARRSAIIDVRSPERFYAQVPEDRVGVRAGHIPGSINIPYGKFVDGRGFLRCDEELRELFAEAGIRGAGDVILTCGSGVTACIAGLALAVLGWGGFRLYDGSWSEWGAMENMPLELS